MLSQPESARYAAGRTVFAAFAVFLLLALSVGLSLGATTAYAWGPDCALNANPNEHCYALAEFYPTTEREGGVAIIDTKEMDVPNTEEVSAFTTNELWTSNIADPNRWIESGQYAGHGENFANGKVLNYGCCSLHRYVAHQGESDGKFFYQEWTEEAAVNENEENVFQIYDPKNNGEWEILWGHPHGTYEHVLTIETAWDKTNKMEAGAEGADDAQPTTRATQEVGLVEGGAWYGWNGSNTDLMLTGPKLEQEKGYREDDYAAPLCISPLTGSAEGPGNTEYMIKSTC
jgi:hypothetical protein